VIRTQSVRAKVVEPGYGYVRISSFQERTVEDLVSKINELYKPGPLKGLVLDLRNDPGGLLNSAIGVAAAFLPARSLVVSTDGRTEDSRRKFIAAPEDYMRGHREDVLSRLPAAVKTVPMVVLVNNASASASEIVAGALQDHKRAVLLGARTFGKGSVQTIIPIRTDDNQPAAIKLTTARYFTPSGRSIQAKGIVPDLHVNDTPEGNFAGLTVREADLAHHLENDTAPANKAVAPKASPHGAATTPGPQAAAPQHRYEFGASDDFQLSQALNQLQGKPVALAKPRENVAESSAAK
jgi:carboxyl-terminal processing protease